MVTSRWLSLSVAISFCVTSIASAQSPLDEARANAAAARDAAQKAVGIAQTNQAELAEFRALLELLIANDERDARIEQYAAENGGREAAAADATEIGARIQGALDQLSDSNLNSALGPELRQQMATCAQDIQKQFKELLDADPAPSIERVQQAIATCSPQDVQRMLDELERKRQEALHAWNQCRDTLLATGVLSQSDIPADPSRLARGLTSQEVRDELEQVRKQVEGVVGSARNCGDRLSELFEDIQNQENAAAAMATMMNFAATACMASGGNPYVCGAVFLFAVLASFFSSGSGDGDGDGKSDGTGQKGDGSNVAGTGPRNGPPTASGDSTGSQQGQTTVIQTRCDSAVENCISCSASGRDRLQCTLKDGPQITIDTKNLSDERGQSVAEASLGQAEQKGLAALRAIIGGQSSHELTICTGRQGDKPPIHGLIVGDGKDLFTVAAKQIDGQIALHINPTATQAVPGKSASRLCP